MFSSNLSLQSSLSATLATVCQQKADMQYLVFYGTLITPLTGGQCLIIGLVAKPDAHCIRINLFSRLGVVNLCLIISFDEKRIKRCAFVDGKWTEEQIEKNLLAQSSWKPIKPNELFTVNIVTGGGKFYIAINETPFCVFPHVIQRDSVQAVRIFGDLKTVRNFDHRQAFPTSIPKFEVNHQKDVFRSQVAKRFSPGSLIILQATPIGTRKGHFVIYIMDDSKIGSCAFYFQARFCKHTVVVDCRNPQFRQGNELTLKTHFPFRLHKEFRMVIALTRTAFNIAVNGEQLCSFPYMRSDLLQDLNGISIRTRNGMDVNVSLIAHLKINSVDCRGYEIFSKE